MSEAEEKNGNHITRRELGSELRAFRSETRLLIVGSFAANQVIQQPDLVGTTIAAVVGSAAYLATFLGK